MNLLPEVCSGSSSRSRTSSAAAAVRTVAFGPSPADGPPIFSLSSRRTSPKFHPVVTQALWSSAACTAAQSRSTCPFSSAIGVVGSSPHSSARCARTAAAITSRAPDSTAARISRVSVRRAVSSSATDLATSVAAAAPLRRSRNGMRSWFAARASGDSSMTSSSPIERVPQPPAPFRNVVWLYDSRALSFVITDGDVDAGARGGCAEAMQGGRRHVQPGRVAGAQRGAGVPRHRRGCRAKGRRDLRAIARGETHSDRRRLPRRRRGVGHRRRIRGPAPRRRPGDHQLYPQLVGHRAQDEGRRTRTDAHHESRTMGDGTHERGGGHGVVRQASARAVRGPVRVRVRAAREG